MTNFILDEGTIAYEDDYLLIIDKPAGMLVHPTVNEWGCTLYDYVTEYYQRKGITANIHPVSRLDRHTSGLVIFAKEPIIQHWLSQQQMDKEYLAIVTGELPNDEGIIEAPIARKEGSIIERCVSENGKYAKTSYKLLAKRKDLSLLQVKLFTGRTHQIRVHMAYIGCPLFNDNLYGTPGPQSRHALHAFKLRFIHPVSDTPVEITRTLPEDLRRIIYY
ncbi:MAG: RluA family pseudouridine synthase [Phascolarctobacterium sp.]|nr:RluA family pseudouridine synthase [Phascolarctobacterium sp.]